VNTTARLQSNDGPGEIVFRETVFEDAVHDLPPAERQVMSLRGKEDPVPIRLLWL